MPAPHPGRVRVPVRSRSLRRDHLARRRRRVFRQTALRHGAEHSTGQRITSAVTTFVALAALIFTGLSLQESQRQNAIAEQSQLTDRYTRAVEQLDRAGDEHLQVRLGGIYALERLTHDSPRDQATIIEVLSAYVRTNAPHTLMTVNCCMSVRTPARSLATTCVSFG